MICIVVICNSELFLSIKSMFQLWNFLNFLLLFGFSSDLVFDSPIPGFLLEWFLINKKGFTCWESFIGINKRFLLSFCTNTHVFTHIHTHTHTHTLIQIHKQWRPRLHKKECSHSHLFYDQPKRASNISQWFLFNITFHLEQKDPRRGFLSKKTETCNK